MNLGRYVTRSAVYHPDNHAIGFMGRGVSYREFECRTNRLARGLMDLGFVMGNHAFMEEMVGRMGLNYRMNAHGLDLRVGCEWGVNILGYKGTA